MEGPVTGADFPLIDANRRLAGQTSSPENLRAGSPFPFASSIEIMTDATLPPDIPTRGRIAGVDYGTVRIGIAISDHSQQLASPLETYTRSGLDADARRFRRLVQEEGLVLFVVGLPIHGDGRESQKSREARTFGAWLTASTGIPVAYYDERYTSVEAERILQDVGFTKKRRDARRDMLAAQLLLQAFLESKHRGAVDPGSLD